MQLRPHYFRHINFKLLAAALVLTLANTVLVRPATGLTSAQTATLTCTDFKFVFARGSGAEIGSDRDFKPFKAAVDEVFGDSDYTYSFYELGSLEEGWSGKSYPAPGIGISTWARFETSLGALLSGGEMHAYGDSVYDGTVEAKTYILQLRAVCPDTKIILAGYSQGAQVISSTLQIIKPDQIFAALTFGDPKLYLPEGKLNWFTRSTAACRNEDLSDYRAYVPDCYAYQGILGGFNPYQPDSGYSGKLKAYCQFHDVICSSYIDLGNLAYGHATYAEQGTYKRAIEDVYNMLEPATFTRPAQDVAILFDNTGSMSPLLSKYKSEAVAVARRTLKKGGRIALYTYGDLAEGGPVQLCNFETCTAENIEAFIYNIEVDGGGDTPESLLSASYTLMRELTWKIGANKSLVVLTDADYHHPDRDGITEADVITLSRSIDPVNFYILTTPDYADTYAGLATQTDGAVYTSDVAFAFSDIEAEILSRDPGAIFTSTDLPTPDPATVSGLRLTQTSSSSVHLDFKTDGVLNFVSLNDYVAGYGAETSLEITDLDLSEPVTVCVSSASASGYRGDPACATTESLTGFGSVETLTTTTIIPKAPNTGRAGR